MDSQLPPSPSLRGLLTRMGCTIVALLLLYPLSSGPTAMVLVLTRHGYRTWENVYTPLVFVAQVTHTASALTAYLNWWGDLGYRLRPRKM